MKLFTLFLIIPVIYAGVPISGPNHYDARALKNLEDRLVNGLLDYLKTGVQSEDLKQAFKLAKAPHIFRNMDDTTSRPIACILCNVGVRVLLGYKDSGASVEELQAAIVDLCVNTEMESETVCKGTVDLNIGIFLYILDTKQDLSAEKICGIIAQPSNCPVPPEDELWEVELPDRIELKNNQKTVTEEPIKILHITDIHYDELYEIGGNAECGEPLCCGSNQGKPAKLEAAAGPWGDYRSCDMPWHTIENLLDQVKKHNFDYFYYTGDIIDHRVWATSVHRNIKNIKKLYKKFRETFTIPVFPILGNHEPNPLNEFAPLNITEEDLTTKWLYETVAEEWSEWLPESAIETVKKGGYYTVLVKPGFRIIALNSNVAYTFNWWLLYDHSILQEQLQWLANTLTEAEKNNEIVHILSHVPTGDTTCLIKWAREFKRIVSRFSHIISAQFGGHTHYDELNLYFEDNDIKKPINVVFNGGSFTTYTNVNPNYVIYDVNPQDLEVEDYHEYIYNITEANQYSLDVPPKWFKLYSFKESYGLKTMKLSDLGKLIETFPKNQTLLDQFYRFKMRDGDLALQIGCDSKCHENNLCNLVKTQFGDEKLCNELIEEYRNTISKNK